MLSVSRDFTIRSMILDVREMFEIGRLESWSLSRVDLSRTGKIADC